MYLADAVNGGGFNAVRIGGVDYESLSPDSLQLFQYMALATHSNWVSTDS